MIASGCRWLRRAPGVPTAVGVLVGGLALAVAWIVWADPLGSLIGTSIPGLGVIDAARGSLARTPRRWVEMIGVFGWLDTDAPIVTYVVWAGATGATAAAALVVGRWRERAGVVLVALAALLLPVASEAMQAAEVGFVWQGRYTLPVAVGIPLLSGAIVSDWRCRGTSPRVDRAARWGAVVIVATLGGAQLLAFAAAARRHLDGLPAPLFGWVGSSDPAAAGPPALLLGVAVLGLGVALLGLVAAARPRQSSRSRRNLPV